jgi:hypothetical protein
MTGPSKSDDAKLKKEAAESLQHQIDDIASGRAQPGDRTSFRDFVEQKMAEDRRKKLEAGTLPEPEQGSSSGTDSSNRAPPKHGRE